MNAKLQLSLATGLLLLITYVKSDCNVCSAKYPFACVQRDAVRMCTDGEPMGEAMHCGPGYLCDLDGLCKAEANVPIVSCEDCNKCDSAMVFACTSENSFALCLGTTKPSLVTGTCSDGYVCNIDSQNICTETFSGATCPQGDSTGTNKTTDPNEDPNGFCKQMKEESRFPVGTNQEIECKQYISCMMTKTGDWIGALYRCPGQSYFHNNNMGCSNLIPARCNAAVRSLSYQP